MTRPWGLIQHVPHEGPGIIATEASARGILLDVRRVYAGDAVHALSEIQGLVVMGGPMGAHDDERHPNLAAERELLGSAVRAGYPVLGVCLGSQLLAAALGGRVQRGPAEENGFGEVILTREGERDPVLGPAGPAIPVCHWHGDTFDIPPGAVHLATSGRYPNQAFRVGHRAYGFQFHVEMDEVLYRGWSPLFPPHARFDKALQPAVERAGKGILRRFLDALACVVLGITLGCVLPGCSTPQRQKTESPQQHGLGPPVEPGQTFRTAYFSAQAPPEPGWALIGTHDSLLAIGKMNWKTRESYAATVWATTLREAPTATQLQDLVDELRRADSMPPRHKLLRLSEPTRAGDGGLGWAYELEVVDQTAAGDGKKPLALEIYALIRQHPVRKNVVVTAKYSYRHLEGMMDPESAKKAKAFLAGVTLLR